MGSSASFNYGCRIWCCTSNLLGLRLLLLLLPLSPFCVGLPTQTKKFTLLRSPLGNSRAKDHFERREFKAYVYFESDKVGKILALIAVLGHCPGIKYRVRVYNNRG
uniref:Ribosomal protein S10 n=1 Tax=Analipus japonicus TaxID=31333 RepID=A0A8F0FF37_9PHAE|nr:ribosomal protein S10 [Analipus japonicus]